MEVVLESLWFVLSGWGDSVTNQVPSIELELAAAASPQHTLFVIVHIFQKFPQKFQSSLTFSKIIAPNKGKNMFFFIVHIFQNSQKYQKFLEIF